MVQVSASMPPEALMAAMIFPASDESLGLYVVAASEVILNIAAPAGRLIKFSDRYSLHTL